MCECEFWLPQRRDRDRPQPLAQRECEPACVQDVPGSKLIPRLIAQPGQVPCVSSRDACARLHLDADDPNVILMQALM